ncbi:beige protein-like 1 [Tilletia horrida]|nr:beige protein-like 1 [Tilletia horrida]
MSQLTRAEAAAGDAVREFSSLLEPASQTTAARVVEAANALAGNRDALRHIAYTSAGTALVERIEELALDLSDVGRGDEAEQQLLGLVSLAERAMDFGGLSPTALRVLLRTVKTLLHHTLGAELLPLVKATGPVSAPQRKRQSQLSSDSHSADPAQNRARQSAAHHRAQVFLKFLLYAGRDARPLTPPAPVIPWSKLTTQQIADDYLSEDRLPEVPHIRLVGGGPEPRIEDVLTVPELACPWEAFDGAGVLPSAHQQSHAGAGVGFTIVMTFQLEDLRPPTTDEPSIEVVNLIQIDEKSASSDRAGAPGPPLVGLAASIIRRPDGAATVMQLHYTSTSFAFAEPSAKSGKMPPNASTTVVFGIGGEMQKSSSDNLGSYSALSTAANSLDSSGKHAASPRHLVLIPNRTYSLLLAHAAPPLAPSGSSDSPPSSRLPSKDMHTPVSLYLDGELIDVRRCVWPRVRPSIEAPASLRSVGDGITKRQLRAEFGGTPALSPLPPRHMSTASPSSNTPAATESGKGSEGAIAGEPTWALRLYTPLYVLRVHLPTSPLPSVGAGPDSAFLIHQLLLPSSYTAHGYTHESSPTSAGTSGGQTADSQSRNGSTAGLGRFLTYAGSMKVNLRLDERSVPQLTSLNGTNHNLNADRRAHAEKMREHALRERRRRLVCAVAGSGSDMVPSTPKSGLGTALEGASGLSPSGFGSLIAGKGRKSRASSSAAEVDPSIAARFALDFWGERQYGMYLSLDLASPRPHSSHDTGIRFGNRAKKWSSRTGADTIEHRLKDSWIERRFKGACMPPRHLLVQLYNSLTASCEAVGGIPVVLELLRLSSWVDPTLNLPVIPGESATTGASRPSIFILLLDLVLLLIGGETSWRTSEEAERTGAWEVLKFILERNARLVIPKPAGQTDENANVTRGWATSEAASFGVLRLLFEAVGRRYVLNKSNSVSPSRISASASASRHDGAIVADDSTWALVNPLLYRLILLDPRTFRFCPTAVRHQHLLHFQALLRDSDYRNFNARRVAKMGIMRRLLSAWNTRLFETSRRFAPIAQSDAGQSTSAHDDNSLEDDLVAAVFTILKVQANDTNVRTITAFLATASDGTTGNPFQRARSSSRAATTRSNSNEVEKLAVKMLVSLFSILKERPNILLRLSASADVRWLVPILAGWKYGESDFHHPEAPASELRTEKLSVLNVVQSILPLNQAGELAITRSLNERMLSTASAKRSQFTQHHRSQSVKTALELLVLLCSTSMRQAQGPQDEARHTESQPAQRNYADRLNATGGFRVLEDSLAAEWNSPGILPLCWAMLFGLPAVPSLSTNGLQSTAASLLEAFGPSRYTTVRNPRALRLILACWCRGLVDLLANRGSRRPNSDYGSVAKASSPQTRQNSRPRSRSMHVGNKEQSYILDQQILEATFSLVEQHCDRRMRREEFRETMFNPATLRILMEALLPIISTRSASSASTETEEDLPERLASRALHLLTRLVTDSVLATNSLDIVEALLSAIPPEDTAQKSVLRCAVLDAILENIARSIGVDLPTDATAGERPKSNNSSLLPFAMLIAQCSEELLSGLFLSSSLLLRLQSGLSEQLIRHDQNAHTTSTSVRQRAKTRSLLLSSMVRVHYVQLVSDGFVSHACRSILDHREWLFGPENTDNNFFQCVLNRAFCVLRHGTTAQERELGFELLCAVTLARPAVAEAGLLLEYSAADILQSSPGSVLGLFDACPEKDTSNTLPYQDSWMVFVKSHESLRRAAHLDRVARIRRTLQLQGPHQSSSRSSELKLRHWHDKMCQSEYARLSRFEQDAREVVRFAKKHQEAMYFDIHRCNSFLDETDVRTDSKGLDPTEGPRRMRKIFHPLQAEAHGVEAFSILPEHNPELVAVSSGKPQRLQSSGNDASAEETLQDKVSQIGQGSEQSTDGQADEEDAKSGVDEQDDDKFRHVLRALDRGDVIDDVFNTSRVVSIECRGTLAIIGRSKLYLLDDYFQRPNGELVNAWEAPAEERDAVVFAALPSSAVQRSTLLLQLDGEARTRKWSWEEIAACFRRTWLHRKTALELFFTDGQSCLLVLPSAELASRLHDSIRFRAPRSVRTAELALSGLSGTSPGSSGFRSRFNNAAAEAWRGRSSAPGALTQAWVENRISNFEYLMNLNSLSGRTYNDFTQYPVMPWILADYTSESLDLSSSSIYRDLTLPMGAQTPARKLEVRERYEQLLEMSEDSNAAFHYGTFFSTATVVSAYLVRVRPYNHVLIALQGGSFDLADRTFSSVGQAWLSASELSRGDVRELTPEFFYLPEMFLNTNRFNFGTTQAGEVIDNVELPPWAKGDPETFVKLHREALESDYVSANLHSWIDLIFGWRSRGAPAIEACNCFHPLSYETSVDLANIESNLERQATAQAIHNFGQMPQQLFTAPHPQRWPRTDHRRIDRLSIEEYPWLMIPSFCPVQEIDAEVHTIDLTQGGPQTFGPFAVPLHDCEVLLSIHKETQSATATQFATSQAPTLPTVTECIIGTEITCITGAGHGVFAIGAADGTVAMCLADRHGAQISILNVLRGHTAPIQCMHASSEWSLLITSSTDGSVFLLPTAGAATQLISVDKNHGYIATCSASVLSLWTVNAEPLAELDIEHHRLGPISALAFLDADVLGPGRLAVLLTGHEGKVASWECVLDAETGSRSGHHWVLRQQYVFQRNDQRYPRSLGRVTAIVASRTRMLTGDARGSLYQWSIPGSEEQGRMQLNTEAVLGGRCAACEKRFGVLETRRVCGGCGGTFCSACAVAETSPQLKVQR